MGLSGNTCAQALFSAPDVTPRAKVIDNASRRRICMRVSFEDSVQDYIEVTLMSVS
jgi:hypothetical protein